MAHVGIRDFAIQNIFPPGVIMKAIGWVLVLALIAWIPISFHFYPPWRSAPKTLTLGSGFEGTVQLPASQIQPHLDQARLKMLKLNGHGQYFSLADNICAWLAFACTALVTLIAGYYGQQISPTKPAKVTGLPQKQTRIVGTVAALAAVLTAGGAMAKNQGRDDYDRADKARTVINQAVVDVTGAKTEHEAQDALSQLDLQIGRL
jgi:hypothetical protein